MAVVLYILTMEIWSRLWAKWKAFSRKLAKIQTIILLTLFYFTLFGFYALLLKPFRKDLLDKRWKKNKSFWMKKPIQEVTLETAKRQS